jgi:dTDP-4-dehydrorhamnose reductase
VESTRSRWKLSTRTTWTVTGLLQRQPCTVVFLIASNKWIVKVKVLIFGKNGQLANELVQSKPRNIHLLCLGRDDIDICNIDEVDNITSSFAPDTIINASAYTAVDQAESDIEAAYAINEHAVKNIALISKKYNCKFFHVSTDFVFDGKSNCAYQVDSTPNPQSVYGASKLAGEEAIKDSYLEGSSIIRTSWVYSSFGNNFVKTMLKLMKLKEELGIVADQIGCPTYAKGLADFIWCLAERSTKNDLIYHWSDAGVASWYDFAISIQELGLEKGLLKNAIPIQPIPSSAYPTPAKRPSFSLIDSASANKACGLSAVHWRKQLSSMMDELLPLNKTDLLK